MQHPITVLLVDDQPIVGAAVQQMLSGEEDIRFHHCMDPLKALETASEVWPTVILQDLVMPQLDGLTLVKFYRANPSTAEVPLIVLSSKEEAETKAQAFALGANDYIVKLPDKLEMLARIRYHSKGYINLLQRNEATRALEASRKILADEIAHAGEYVRSLLPNPIAEGDVRTSWKYVPSMQLGGDIFGYHWLDDGHFAVFLLDVCGHGVGASLLAVSVMNAIAAQGLPGTDFKKPDQVLAALNDAFPMERHKNMYFTMWYGIYNRKDRQLTYASGGHPPAILVENGKPYDLETAGAMIGGWSGVAFSCGSKTIAPESRLFVFSDGMFEIFKPDGEMWPYEEFLSLLRAPPQAGVHDADRIMDAVRRVRGSDMFDDDASLVEVLFK
jgi:sigma-B regulation protein RsbU (phosphoserine phosphatase)